jgi:hypothetical protein
LGGCLINLHYNNQEIKMDISISPNELWLGEQVSAVLRKLPGIMLNRSEIREINDLLGIIQRLSGSVNTEYGGNLINQATPILSDLVELLRNGHSVTLKFFPDAPMQQQVVIKSTGRTDKKVGLYCIVVCFIAMKLDTDTLLQCHDKYIDINLSA